jgi:hypothetical protein
MAKIIKSPNVQNPNPKIPATCRLQPTRPARAWPPGPRWRLSACHLGPRGRPTGVGPWLAAEAPSGSGWGGVTPSAGRWAGSVVGWRRWSGRAARGDSEAKSRAQPGRLEGRGDERGARSCWSCRHAVEATSEVRCDRVRMGELLLGLAAWANVEESAAHYAYACRKKKEKSTVSAAVFISCSGSLAPSPAPATGSGDKVLGQWEQQCSEDRIRWCIRSCLCGLCRSAWMPSNSLVLARVRIDYEWVILVRLHREIASSGTRCSSCKVVVLVTLGGCHLLDGLVASSPSWSTQEDRAVLRKRICEGYHADPTGAAKSNTSRACHWATLTCG